MLRGVVVVTGVTAGIGKTVVEMIIQEYVPGRDVTLVCGVRPCSVQEEKVRLDALRAERQRGGYGGDDDDDGNDSVLRVVVLEVDLSVRESIEKFARAVQQYAAVRDKSGSISLLINNAAEFPDTTREASMSAVTVNAVAPAMLIELLQPMRCCNIVSFTHRSVSDTRRWMMWARSSTGNSTDSNSYSPAEVYMNTKFALVMLSVYYARTRDVVMFDPGAVDTMLTRRFPPSLRMIQRVGMYASMTMIDVRAAATGLLRACSSRVPSSIRDSSSYFFGSMAVRLPPSSLCNDESLVALSARIFIPSTAPPYSTQ